MFCFVMISHQTLGQQGWTILKIFPTIIATRGNVIIAMILCPYLVNVSFPCTTHMPFSLPHFCKTPQLPLYTLGMCTNATYFKKVCQMSRLIDYALNYLHNKKKCDLVANSGSCLSCNTFMQQLHHRSL